MAQKRRINQRLAAVIAESGMSHAQVARAFVRVALENGATEFAGVARSHVSHWVAGAIPSGRGPSILGETLSRKLGRSVTPYEIGLTDQPTDPDGPMDWYVDPLTTLTDFGRTAMDAERRRILGAATFSVAALALPEVGWWAEMADRGRARGAGGGLRVGHGDVDAVRHMASLFSQIDQRRGGGHARSAVVQYLTSDVAGYLRGHFLNDGVRRDMFSAASELAYLVGWMAFDNAEHALAQHFYTAALKLAAEAEDAPMAGHILRAMAHQAIDLGHGTRAHRLASASMSQGRYTLACPRERALLGVVYARSLASTGRPKAAAAALLRAENDLAAATSPDREPARVFFFGEASLAHEMALTLNKTGDLSGAVREFRRSARTRPAATFTRTHAVTLGYLGMAQAHQGSLDEACASWSAALNVMDGIRSGRTRQVAKDIQTTLAVFQGRGSRVAGDLDARARAYLAATG